MNDVTDAVDLSGKVAIAAVDFHSTRIYALDWHGQGQRKTPFGDLPGEEPPRLSRPDRCRCSRRYRRSSPMSRCFAWANTSWASIPFVITETTAGAHPDST